MAACFWSKTMLKMAPVNGMHNDDRNNYHNNNDDNHYDDENVDAFNSHQTVLIKKSPKTIFQSLASTTNNKQQTKHIQLSVITKKTNKTSTEKIPPSNNQK